MFSFYLSFGDDKFIVASLMSSTFVFAHVSRVHLHLFTNVTCYRLLCSLMLVVCICIFTNVTCHRLLCSLNLVVCTCTFSQMSHVIDCLCSLMLVVFICILSQMSPVTILPGLARLGGVLTGKVCSESKLGDLQLFHSF